MFSLEVNGLFVNGLLRMVCFLTIVSETTISSLSIHIPFCGNTIFRWVIVHLPKNTLQPPLQLLMVQSMEYQ